MSWGKWTFVIIKNFTVVSSAPYLFSCHFLRLFLCAQCFKRMYLFYPYNNPIGWIVLFCFVFHLIEGKTADLSHLGPFNRKVARLETQVFLILQPCPWSRPVSFRRDPFTEVSAAGIIDLVLGTWSLSIWDGGWGTSQQPQPLKGCFGFILLEFEVTYLPTAYHLPKNQEIYLKLVPGTRWRRYWESLPVSSPEWKGRGTSCMVSFIMLPCPLHRSNQGDGILCVQGAEHEPHNLSWILFQVVSRTHSGPTAKPQAPKLPQMQRPFVLLKTCLCWWGCYCCGLGREENADISSF